MLNKIIKEKYFCGIDIGAQKIKAGILKVKDVDDMELVGAYEHETYGFKNNAVSDLSEFSECINKTVHELTKKVGVKIKEVQLGVGGSMVEARQTNTEIPLIDRGSKVIVQRDIKKVNNNARLLGIKMEEEILHDLPQSYQVDDANSALNPLGLCGRKLGVHSLMIIINGNRIRNVTKAVHQAGYDVANVFFSSYASSGVILTEEEKKDGCVLVDVGAQGTTVLIFRDGVLCFLSKISAGGNDFTRSIANRIHLSFDLAEEIKKSYGLAQGFDQYRDEEILVKREDSYVPIKRGMIYEGIRPEMENLEVAVQQAVNNSGLSDEMKKGMTIIGGGALLPGFIERMGEVMRMPAKLGKVNILLRKNLSYTAVFSSVVGLGRCGFKKTFRYSFASNGRTHWSQQALDRIKELYQEYF